MDIVLFLKKNPKYKGWSGARQDRRKQLQDLAIQALRYWTIVVAFLTLLVINARTP